MTDKVIIQALRLCSCETSTRNCSTCPLSGNDDCVTDALRGAADIIERLTAENAVPREKQLWNPVLDGAPKEKGCYLVTIRNWLDGTPVVREAFWNGVDWLSGDRRHAITPRVTHWMPLPEAPEGAQ